MRNAHRVKQGAAWLVVGSLISWNGIAKQAGVDPKANFREAREVALPLPEDRGAAALTESLRRLSTWASLMCIVAHPDDEDGAMLTYESRGRGVRSSLLTLTRGEGGQNAMSADTDDALGMIRTNELLRASEFYGVQQYWGTEADFGFSKTQEESFKRWGHDRVLFDAVLAIRRERPLVLVATFVGGITDGHGQHQVSGEIEQEAYDAAGDPKVFPEQIAAGLRPWKPLKVYARVPFAPVSDKGMFDYATGKWAPAKFYNYVTKEWTTTAPKGDVNVPSGELDPVLGRSYMQIAREGWGEQKSQYGGANPQLSGGEGSDYHRYGSRVAESQGEESGFFDGIPTGIEGLAMLAGDDAPDWLKSGLGEIAAQVATTRKDYLPEKPEGIAPALKSGYLAAEKLRELVSASQLPEAAKANLEAELGIKMGQFQTALAEALGLDLQVYTVRNGTGGGQGGPFGGSVDETSRSVTPGQAIKVRVHTGNAFKLAKLSRVWLESSDGKSWSTPPGPSGEADQTLAATVPADETPTEPYFSRPSPEQAYYDVSDAALRGYSFGPYPLAGWAEFDYQGVPVRLGEVVQTMQRVPGKGGVLEPLVVTPPIGVRVAPEARLLAANHQPLPVRVTVHTEGAASGTVRLTLPAGWTAAPAEASFKRTMAGDTEPILFEVTPGEKRGGDATYLLKAEADVEERRYESGWKTIGYPGLRPYNLYRKAEMTTRSIDAKMTPGLRVGYVMGTGDMVPEALEALGVTPHLLSAQEINEGDLSQWDVILIGIRAYSMRPELTAAEARLNAFVRAGGTLVVQYQSADFPAPFPLTVGRAPERVVEEAAPVKLLAEDNPLLNSPNKITPHDFDGWVEERGHSFLGSWDAAYTPLTETGDEGQDLQRGGLLVAHPGKGTYVYVAYALYRQFPALVPGAYRLLANLVSAGK